MHVHLVFVTKYRQGVLTGPILDRCQEVMADVCRDFGAELSKFDGEDDHVHLLIEYPPTVQISKLVNSLKGVSSRYLRKEFQPHLHRDLWGGHLWAPSYFAGTCGAPLSVVKDYITNQRRPTA